MEFADLLPEVLPDVPGCSDPLAERAIRNAAIEFHQRSKIDRRALDAIDIVADEPEYSLVLPQGTALVDIRRARVDGQPVVEKSRDQLDQLWADQNRKSLFRLYHTSDGGGLDADSWDTATSARPQFFFQPDKTSIRLVGIPTANLAGGLTLNVALKPTPAATGIEDWIYNDYYRVIAAGAIAELALLQDKPWTNPGLAAISARQFNDGIAAAHGDALRDHGRNDRPTGRTRTYV